MNRKNMERSGAFNENETLKEKQDASNRFIQMRKMHRREVAQLLENKLKEEKEKLENTERRKQEKIKTRTKRKPESIKNVLKEAEGKGKWVSL